MVSAVSGGGNPFMNMKEIRKMSRIHLDEQMDGCFPGSIRNNFVSAESTPRERKWKRLIAVLGLALSLAVWATAVHSQQDKSKRPSPPASAHFAFPDGKSINVDYSSPRLKGRKIHGPDGLNPDGKVWRAGANEATTFVTDTDTIVGGKGVPAGNYTLFVVPNPESWTLIISKKTGEWGIPYPGESFDLVRTEMKVSQLPEPHENFTISFEKTESGGILRMDWATTRASVTISEKK
jgi:DUF2911 family protein